MVRPRVAPQSSRAWIWLLAFAVTCLGPHRSAFAVNSAERSAARQLGQQGVTAYQDGDYARALDRLERAYQTLPTPALALWSARCLEKLGRWVEASELYLQATRIPADPQGDAAVQAEARQDAAKERENLSRRIPVLVVEVTGATQDVEVRVGDVVIGPALLGADLPTDPGLIRVSARSGEQTREQEVQLAEGERKTVQLSFEGQAAAAAPTAAPTPTSAAQPRDETGSKGSWHKPVGWTAIGVGVAGLAIGAGFGLDAIAKRDASASHCDEADVCNPTGTELRNQGLTSATISTTAFAVGAALAAGGVVLLIVAPRQSEGQVSLGVVPTVGGAGLIWRGRF